MNLNINPELAAYMPALMLEESTALEASIVAEGCREPIAIWEGVIVDGHNRYEICQRRGVPFETVQRDFADIDAAKIWMDENQIGRRNISKNDHDFLMGRINNRETKAHGGDRKSMPQSEALKCSGGRTSESIAKKFGVSRATVERNGQYAKSLGVISETAGIESRNVILAGVDGMTREHINTLASDTEAQQLIASDIADGVDPAKAIRSAVGIKRMSGRHSIDGDDEYHTPSEYLESARKVMGSIDTDPASNDEAQKRVNAGRYYTIDDSSLDVEWHGNAWMNPPYSDPLCGHFCGKLAGEYRAGRVKQAITMTNNSTDAKWFHLLASDATGVCLHSGRISFIKNGVPLKGNTRGQVIFYFGPNMRDFADEFSQYGETFIKDW